MNKISKYFRGVAEEARRVRWPDQRTLWKAVGIVMVISIVAALATVLSDYLTVLIMKSFEIALPTSSSSSSSSEAAAMLFRFINGGKF